MKPPTCKGRETPTIADYAHWGEEAQAVWYAENRYDMEHPEDDEPADDDFDDLDDEEENIP